MQGYVIKQFRIVSSVSEMQNIYNNMLYAYENKNEFSEMIYEGEFKAKLVMSDQRREQTKVTKEDDLITIKITVNEMRTILNRMNYVLDNRKVGESLKFAEYMMSDNAFIVFYVQQ